ncbi:ulp1 protease family protein [Colletotrichum asianum]|uniref:Ulp1 protease family protein n=1 Tax=Colletotrichum asianum TaxID=702518 RepID=A0A8H3VZU9_9PEZI|nr:ulp1 protease family protein [Colletotrichum asianum]
MSGKALTNTSVIQDSREVDNDERNLENELENFRIILRDHLAAGEDVVAKWEAICSRFARFASVDSLLERLSRDDQESLHYIREQGRRIRSKKALILREWNWSEDDLVETFPDVDSRAFWEELAKLVRQSTAEQALPLLRRYQGERQVGVRGSNRSVMWKPWEVKRALEHLKNQAEGRHLSEDQSERRQDGKSPEDGRLKQPRETRVTHDSVSGEETSSPTPDTSGSNPRRETAPQRRNSPDESEPSSDNAVEEVKATGKLTSIAKASLRVERRLSREGASSNASKPSARVPTRRTAGGLTKDDDGMAEPHEVAGLDHDIKLQLENNVTDPTPSKGQTRKRLPEDQASDVGRGSSSTHDLPVRGSDSTPSKKPRTSNDVLRGLESPFTPSLPPNTTAVTGLPTPDSTRAKPSIILRKRTVLSSNTEDKRPDIAERGLDDALESVDFEIPPNFQARLAPGAELDDGVITTCLDVFSSTTGLGCSIINPHLFKAGSTTRYASVQVAIARSETTKILVPLHLPDSHHWVLCCVLKDEKEIQVYDSLAGDNDEVHRLLYALQNLYFEDYRITPRPCYQQVNGYDCGICLLVNAVHLMTDLHPPTEVSTSVWRNCFRALGDSTATPSLLPGIPYSRESFKIHLEFSSGSFTIDELNALWAEKQNQFKTAVEEHQAKVRRLTPEVQLVLEMLEKAFTKLTGDEQKRLLEQWDRESRHEDDAGGWMHGQGRAERRHLRRAKQRVLNALPRLEHAVRYLQAQLDHLTVSKKELDGLKLSLDA